MSDSPAAHEASLKRMRFSSIIVATGVSLRILSFFFSANAGGDAWAREALTASWLRHASLKLDFNAWLPLHFWLMGGLATILADNVQLAGRLLSLLAGTASLLIFTKLVRSLYGERAAQFGLAIFALCSLDIAYSTTSSSEATYLLFVLLGLLGFFSYRQSGSPRRLAFSGIFFSLAATTRYEAWVLIVAVGLLVAASIWKNRNFAASRISFQPLLLFSLTAGFGPIIIMFHNWVKFHKLLYGVSANQQWVTEQLAFSHESLAYRLLLFPGVLLLTLTPFVIIGGLHGFFLSFKTKIGTEFALLTVFFAMVQFYQIASAHEMAFARYTMTLGMLVAILSGYGLDKLGQNIFPQQQSKFRNCLVGILLLNLLIILGLSELPNRFSEKFVSVSPILRYPRRIESLAAFLRPRMNSQDNVVVDDYNSESNIVAHALGLPLPVGSRAFLAGIRPASELLGYVNNQHPHYFIYSDRGVLTPSLPLKCNSSISGPDADVSCLYHNDVYTIYEVRYRQ